MKVKQLLAAVLLMGGTGAWAQTDVTSTYLTNADFSEGPVITADIRGYGKDMASGDVYGFQDVTGWTKVVTAADNSNASYPNSGMAGGVLAYGSTNQLKGNNVTAPAAGPDESSVNGLGFFGVWGCGGYYYQDVTLVAGKYKLTFPIYCISGTQANTTYTGFFPTSGKNHTVAINTTVGSWVNQTVEFTLAAETAGQIRLGYQSTGSGSGANPHLVFDGVKIEFTAVVVKDVLENAITAATAANNVLADADLAQAIAAAQAVYDSSSATQDQINAAAAALNSATEVAMDGKDVTDIFLTNADMSSQEGWTPVISSQYRDYGNGLIGEYNVRFSAATFDETHLATEYCFGVECRWETNYASFTQSTATLPAGVYTFTYDVENVNGTTSSGTYNNLFFAQVGGTKFNDNSTEWMKGKSAWTTHTITATLNEASPLTLSLGYGNDRNLDAAYTPAIYVSHLSMTYSSFLAGAQKAWQEAGKAAAAAIAANPNVTGSEKAALVAACSTTPEATVEGYNNAAETINALTATLEAAAPAYNSIVALNARAEAASIEAYAITAETTAAELNAAIPAFENSILVAEHTDDVAAFNEVQTNYPYEIALGDWTTSGAVKNEKGQHWNGDADATYNEPNSWSTTSGGTSSWTQEVALPAGSYVLQIAGRHSESSEFTVAVKNGEEELASASDFPAQGSGYGIDLEGNANFDMSGSYANTTGRGWEWRLLSFTLEEETTVTVAVEYSAAVTHQWASFTSYVIRSQFPKEKIDLLNTIKAAEAVDLTANVGTGVFKKNFVDDGTLANAITTAKDVYDNADATVTDVTEAISTLNSTKETVVAAYKSAELNAPAETDIYSLFLADGGDLAKTVTFKAGNASQGTFSIGYTEDAGSIYNQAIHFAKVEANKYNLYIIDAEGVKQYICTSATGWGDGTRTDRIRVTSDAEKALAIEVIATEEEGVYNLFNTEANALLGSNGDTGFFTASTYKAFNINAAEEAAVELKVAAGRHATRIFPFNAELPEGIKAYACETVEDKELTLTPATELKANVPYILENTTDVDIETSLSGYGVAKDASYTAGLLTGVYAPEEISAGYVLQTQDGTQAFYAVDSEVAITVPAHRAYLTVPASSEAKAFFFPSDIETAIQNIEAQGLQNATIFNLAGQRVNKTQKGIYVVNGKKVAVK